MEDDVELIGRTLNHYRVIEKLGSGGMGDVYLAEDTRLNRKVALKILPPEVASDPERRGRFEREAQAVAALNHPNIVTIHSVEEAQGHHYITMELIQGRTLTQMIPAKGLPLAKLFDFAIPIADAVSAAHKRGITHRDLKPDNIMLSDDGRIKILDFGLVKLKEQTAGDALATNLPTAAGLTSEGKIMGTVAYMSPEQAEGKPVDHRSDIFSLGVVFYQMATGKQPFQGETRMSILSSILRDTPASVTDLNPSLPRHLGRVIKRCLAKDPEERYQTSQDLKNELVELRKEVQSGAGEPAVAAAPPRRTRSARGLTFLLFGAGAIAVAAVGYLLIRPAGRAEPDAPPLHGSFTQLTDQPGEEVGPSLSPDGRMLAYCSRAGGNWDIYVQSISGRNAVDVTKDSPALDLDPAFSPDGQKIAFRSDREGGGIFLMGVLGDSVVRLTDEGFRPAWSPDGTEIAYETEGWPAPNARSGTSALWAVNVETRQKRKITGGDAVQPAWSPHGTRIAYWGIVGASGQRDIWTIPAAGGTPVPVTRDSALDWNPFWSPDGRFLYFISDRDGNMNAWRVPIDEASGQPRGAFQPVTQGATGAVNDLRVSSDGSRFVYAASVVRRNIQRYSLDPEGNVVGEPVWVTRGSEGTVSPDPSPDGAWIAYQLTGKQEDIFLVRADGSGRRQLTHDAARDRMPRWSPDGKKIAFYSDRSGSYEFWTVSPDGSDLKQITEAKDRTILFPLWSPDGSKMFATDIGGDGSGFFDPSRPWREQKVEPLPPHGMGAGQFTPWSWSPDGTKLAGIIFAGGKYDTGIVIYDIPSRKYTRITDSGAVPIWLNDNRHLLMSDGASSVLMVDSVTKSSKPILSVAPDEIDVLSFSLSRDGRSLYLVRVDRQSDLWMFTLQ